MVRHGDQRHAEERLLRHADQLAELAQAFERDVAAVQAALPPERLLVFEVKDGWQPLCTFLDQPVPDVPFPRTNNTAEFWSW